MMFLVSSNPCETSSVLGTILFIKKMIQIITIALPVILVLLLTIDFAKAAVKNDKNEMKEVQSTAFKRIVYAVLVFLVPIIVDAAFNLIGTNFNTLTCYTNATEEKIDAIRKKEEKEKEEQSQSEAEYNKQEQEKQEETKKQEPKKEETKKEEPKNQKTKASSSSESKTSSTKTSDNVPSCTLSYNDVKDELKFSKVKNAVSYAIVKHNAKPTYRSSLYTINPGSDRTDSTANTVYITYKGYVKNNAGKVGTCTLKVGISRGAAAVAYGKKFLGKPYCHYWVEARKNWYGQKHLVCTDCSGFVGGIYIHLGKKGFSRDDDAQCRDSYSKTHKVSGRNSVSGAKIGDIVCFGKTRSNGSIDYTHVALYLGETQNGRVRILQMGGGHGKANIDTRSKWVKIVRVNNN